MSFLDERDYAEESANRADMEREGREELAAEVAELAHVDYPHEPGYLVDCPACESRCHCAGTGNAECVFHAEDNPHR